MKTVTEVIKGINPIPSKDQIIIVTGSDKQIWCLKDKYNDQADTITYNERVAGDTFVATKDSSKLDKNGKPIYLAGAVVELTKPSNEFVCLGKHPRQPEPKSYSKLDLIVELHKLGIEYKGM